MFFSRFPGSLRTIPPSPLGLHTSHLSGVGRWNWIQSHWEYWQVRWTVSRGTSPPRLLATLNFLYTLGNLPPQPLISLREQLYTEHFFKKKLLNDLIFFIAYFLYSCVLFLISIIPKSGLVLGLEESSVFEVVNCCWTVYPVSHIPGMWRTPTQPQTRTEETLWTPQTPCSWLLPAVTPFAVECPKAIVWQWHLLKTPRNLKTTVDVARDFHIAILVNTTRGFTF